jgi:hypothetical protein
VALFDSQIKTAKLAVVEFKAYLLKATIGSIAQRGAATLRPNRPPQRADPARQPAPPEATGLGEELRFMMIERTA